MNLCFLIAKICSNCNFFVEVGDINILFLRNERKNSHYIKARLYGKKLEAVVLDRFLKAGLDVVACKMSRLSEDILREHYAHIVGKPYYPPLVEFMGRRPVIIAILEGDDAIVKVRKLLGPTNSLEAPAGTIRGDMGTNTRENIAHASDSVESAQAEIARFLNPTRYFSDCLTILY